MEAAELTRWSLYVGIGLAVWCGVVNLIYAWVRERRRVERGLRVMIGVVCLYFGLVYGLAAGEAEWWALRSGLMTRMGVVALLVLITTDTWLRWRRI